MTPALPSPDFQPIIQMVLDSVTSPQSKRAYKKALEDFLQWYSDTRPESGLSKATVQQYRSLLIDAGLSASTVNLRLTAIRKLAQEAGDNGLLPFAIAQGIGHVPNVKREGVRTGNWLTLQQAEKLLAFPDATTLRGKRDRALLSVLIGCGLRREEASNLKLEHIQLRDARWVIVDLVGKGNRVRSVPMPAWCKVAIDEWHLSPPWQDVTVHWGPRELTPECVDVIRHLFRPVDKGDSISGWRMTPQSIYMLVKRLCEASGLGNISPHDLRRTFAKLAHKGRAQLEQIQLSLGHASIVTTERYLGVTQDLVDAPCDRLGIRAIGE